MNTNTAELDGARILVLNWRDIRHPLAGGAEQFMHEIGARWVQAGAQVTWLTARPDGQPAKDRIDGMHILRAGNSLSVYARAAARLVRTRGYFDVVVDCQNGTPFFSPLFLGSHTPVVQVVNHVHQDQFSTHFPVPVAALGRWLEGPAVRRVYGSRPTVAVSPSTRHELRRRLRFRGPIFVVPHGTTTLPPSRPRRATQPTIVVVSRQVPHKRIELLLAALPVVVDQVPDLRVEILGDGPDRVRLESLARELGLNSTVRFHGRVSDEVRDDLLSRAWLTTSTSQAEGWGSAVLEAAAWGVPCLALRVPGIRDSVLNGETGWLIDAPNQLAPALVSAMSQLADRGRAEALATSCRAWAGCFSWDRSADLLAGVLLSEMRHMSTLAAGGPVRPREGRSDIAVLAVGRTPAQDVRHLLRSTDEVVHSGDRTTVVLTGCDESGAAAVLDRIGLQDSSLRLADNRLLLAGPTVFPAPEQTVGELDLDLDLDTA